MVVNTLVGEEHHRCKTKFTGITVSTVGVHVVKKDIVTARECNAGSNRQRHCFDYIRIFHGWCRLEGYINIKVKAAGGGY